jgi:phage replication-related protein YjqB (UPF0714/DUF867 family)
MADTYADYAALAAAETEGVDYQILSDTPAGATWASIAIHAGGIEPGSGEMARQVAGDDMAWYKFEGIKSSGNSVLHITATNFDEPVCVALVAASSRTLSFHGYAGTSGVPETAVGGLDPLLTGAVVSALGRAGYAAGAAPYEIAGTDAGNICNANLISGGVQLEMSQALRESFFPGGDYGAAARAAGVFTDDFYRYATAVRGALAGYGAISLGSANVSRYCLVPAASADVDLVVSIATDQLAAGGSEYVHLLARAADTSNWYSARLAFTTTQTVELTIRKRVAGSESAISSTVDTGLTHAAGDRVALRLQVVGTTLRAAAWMDGFDEELLATEVTDTSLAAAGSVGVRGILSSSYSGTLPVEVTFGDFQDRVSPQTFTVTRSVNGVVKALADGVGVQLWRPGLRVL